MTIQIKRGKKENMPTLKEGELALATDEKKLYIGTGTENIPGLMTVDTEMSDSSRNAVQNKAAKKYVDSHIDDTAVHITTEERNMWNDKSDFSGSYDDLTEKPTIPPAYTHPVNHPATMITQDVIHRFVTDDEKAGWNAKIGTDGDQSITGNLTLVTSPDDSTGILSCGSLSSSLLAIRNDNLFTGLAFFKSYDQNEGGIWMQISHDGKFNIGCVDDNLQPSTIIDAIHFNNLKLKNIATPVENNDAATKKYVDDHSVDPATVPKFTSGTTDLVAGTSPLANGTIHFVYE